MEGLDAELTEDLRQPTMEQSDSGGVAAIKGFTYQNLVAAYYILTMLLDKTLVSVRCEVIDDIDLVYDDRVEYVQVKTTDADCKWKINDFAEAKTKEVPPVKPKRKMQTVSREDSILHKSIMCDKEQLEARFRIFTSRDVVKSLGYLKIPLNDRDEKKAQRGTLLRKLKSAVDRNREKTSTFKSPNDNDVEYWLDHAEWTVVPTKNELEMQCIKLIHQASHENGCYLTSNGDPERILGSLLKAVFDKGEASRVLKTIANKSYHRKNFIPWFYAEIEYYTSLSSKHVKVYQTNSSKVSKVLSKFFNDSNIYDFLGSKSCTGVKGDYHQRKYNYRQIAENIQRWLPEVLLLPSEIAENSYDSFSKNISIFTDRYKSNIKYINRLVSKSLLHSIIRTEYKSQPIAVWLHVDDNERTCFDNIHIILNDHKQDGLVMGFSEILNNNTNIKNSISTIISEFDELLQSEAFSSQKEKILTAKDDSFILKHDIDEILQSNVSLDENLDRFRFIFFIGYKSTHLECNFADMNNEYLDQLINEVKSHFKYLINGLILKNDYYEDLNIDVYLYPIPSPETLMSAVHQQGDIKWNKP